MYRGDAGELETARDEAERAARDVLNLPRRAPLARVELAAEALRRAAAHFSTLAAAVAGAARRSRHR